MPLSMKDQITECEKNQKALERDVKILQGKMKANHDNMELIIKQQNKSLTDAMDKLEQELSQNFDGDEDRKAEFTSKIKKAQNMLNMEISERRKAMQATRDANFTKMAMMQADLDKKITDLKTETARQKGMFARREEELNTWMENCEECERAIHGVAAFNEGDVFAQLNLITYDNNLLVRLTAAEEHTGLR